MDKVKTAELLQRSLGLRHKIRVHESIEKPDTHEDLAIHLLAKWELEDELRAIEELMADIRQENVIANKKLIATGIIGKKASKASKKNRR